MPHLTMMLANGWKPVNSNAVLQATCNGPFREEYEALRHGDPSEQMCYHLVREAVDVEVQLTRNKVEKVARAYLVVFDATTQVKFEGTTKEFH